MEASTNRVSVGKVISETFSIYGQNFLALIGASIVVFVIVGVGSGLLDSADSAILRVLGGILRLAGLALFAGFVVKLVEDVRDGRRDQTVGDLFAAAAPAILPLILFGIMFGIGVGLVFLLVAISFVLVIVAIPVALFLATFWSVGAPAIVAERVGPIAAFGRSWDLVKGQGWSVFWTLFVVSLIVAVIQIILGAIATPISNGAIVVASIISTVITAPIFALTVSVMFFDLGGGRAQAAPAAPPAPEAPAA